MRRETLSVVGACALGAFIGTLLALDIAARFQYGSYLWGIGALVGGMVAYVAVDFQHFHAGIVRSYHETLAWRPNPLYWKAVGMTYLGAMSIVSTLLLFFAITGLAIGYAGEHDATTVLQNAWALRWVVGFLVAAVAVITGLLSMLDNKYDKRHSRRANIEIWLRARRMGYEVMVEMNALNVSIMAIHYGSTELWSLIVNLPRFIKMAFMAIMVFVVVVAQFVARMFVYVHSSRRTLCLVDATFGAAIGYSFGSATIGAVAGVVLGVVNYELISVRWLKLAPQTTH